MPSPNSAFSELVTTTYVNTQPDFADNVTSHNALLSHIMKKGRKRMESGGLSIVQPLMYAENSTYTRFDDYDPLPTNASETLSSAEFQWRNIAVFIGSSGTELRKNAGKERIINLATAKIENARATMSNGLSVDIYSDGTLSKQINGIQALITDNGLGTVGGINAASFPFWQNVVQSAAAPIQGGSLSPVTSGNIEELLLAPYLETERGTDMVDLIIASNDYYAFFEKSQVAFKQYVNTKKADGGFMGLQFHGATILHDGGSGIPGAHMYGINSKYLELVTHTQADMTLTDEVAPPFQDAVGRWILWMGNLVCSNRALQFVVKA